MRRLLLLTLFVLTGCLATFANQPSGIQLNPNGTSYIYPPFDTHGWDMTQGPEVGQVLHDHDGDDYYAQDWANGCFSEGRKVFAGISGTVLINPDSDGNQDYYGNTVVILDPQTGFAVRYAHLESILGTLYQGAYVDAGTLIGKVGHTGYCRASDYCRRQGGFGGHLHIALYKNVWNTGARPVWRSTDFNSSGTRRRSTEFSARFSFATGVQLVKGSSQTVYAISGNTRMAVTWFVFGNQGWDFDRARILFNPVQTWPDWQINQYPEGFLFPPRNGTLVRGTQSQTVYFISDGRKRGVPYDEFVCREFSFADVAIVDQSEVERYPDGTSVDNLSGCSTTLDPSDDQARTDMINRGSADFRLQGPIEGTFGKNTGWDPSWELRWLEFNCNGNRTVTIFHATATFNRSLRLTGYSDPDTEAWTGWTQAR